jgi:energy-coupling factor transporter transmembrane protein EcfT
MDKAVMMALTTSSVSVGLTSNASFNSLAAPVSSLNINTPLSIQLATYSFATRFIPSLKGVINAISAAWYSAQSSSKER